MRLAQQQQTFQQQQELAVQVLQAKQDPLQVTPSAIAHH